MRWAYAAVPFLLAVVLFLPATLGGKVLSASDQPLHEPPFGVAGTAANPLQYDAAYVFEPDGLEVRDALRDGRLPTWSTAQSAGTPLLAQQQSAPLFPLTWLGVIFPFFGSLVWIAVAKLALAALGTALFARALGLRPSAALFAGVSFGFGTYLVDWLMHPHVNAYVLLPWLFWLGDRLVDRGRVRDAGWLGLVVGLSWLSGQPESALLVCVPAAAWLLYRSGAWRARVLGAAAGVVGVLLGAVMLLPLIEALHHATETSRAGAPLPLRSALSLFAPEWWGSPTGRQTVGPSNFTERTLYVGAAPLLLAIAGLFARRPDGPQRFFAALALIGVLFAWDTGPIASVAADLPVLDRINLTRTLALAAFALSVLGGYGLHRLLVASAQERRQMLRAVLILVAVPTVLGIADDGDLTRTASLRWLAFGLATVALVLLARRRRFVGLITVAVAAADLLLMGAGYNPAITKAEAQPAPTAALHAMQVREGRVLGVGGLEPNTGSRWGLLDARGHEQPSLQRTTSLYNGLVAGLFGASATAQLEPRGQKLLDVFGVRTVLLPPDPKAAGRPGVVHAGPDGTVLANPSGLPRAFVAYGWESVADRRAAEASIVRRHAIELRDTPAVETRDAPPPGQAPSATTAGIIGREDTSVTILADAIRPGRLVLLDTFYPGWQATVDGRRVSIAATNAAFRSVPIPAGRHRVRFEYKPASVRWGAIVSLAALVFLTLAIVLGGRRSELRD